MQETTAIAHWKCGCITTFPASDGSMILLWHCKGDKVPKHITEAPYAGTDAWMEDDIEVLAKKQRNSL